MGRHQKDIPVKGKFGEVDLSCDISTQPIAFAQWYCDGIFEHLKANLELKVTPEVLQIIEDTYEQQRQIMEQGKVDWKNLSETYITV